MKRIILVATLLFTSVLGSIAQKTDMKCPPRSKLKDITACPNTGCGSVDPHLNAQKDLRNGPQTPVPKTLQNLKDLPDPVTGFKTGATRDKLQRVGQGSQI